MCRFMVAPHAAPYWDDTDMVQVYKGSDEILLSKLILDPSHSVLTQSFDSRLRLDMRRPHNGWLCSLSPKAELTDLSQGMVLVSDTTQTLNLVQSLAYL